LTNQVVEPAVPASLGGQLQIEPVTLPWLAAHPDYRDFVIRDTIAASEASLAEASEAVTKMRHETNTPAGALRGAELTLAVRNENTRSCWRSFNWRTESMVNPTRRRHNQGDLPQMGLVTLCKAQPRWRPTSYFSNAWRRSPRQG
jgi:hypothetical protein